MGDQVSTRPSLKNQVLFDLIFNHFNNVNTFSRFRKNYTLKDSRLRGKRNLPFFMNNLFQNISPFCFQTICHD